MDGPSGALVDKVLTEKAEALLEIEGSETDMSWKKATALVETMVSDEAPPAQVNVIVDTAEAVPTNGEAGVVLDGGSSVGLKALSAILCDSVTQVTGRTEDGRYMDDGRKHRTAPPALRLALLAEARFTCSADGCNSRAIGYRFTT